MYCTICSFVHLDMQVKGPRTYQNGLIRRWRKKNVWYKVVQNNQVWGLTSFKWKLHCWCLISGPRCGHTLFDFGDSLMLIGGHQKIYDIYGHFFFKQMSGVFAFTTSNNSWKNLGKAFKNNPSITAYRRLLWIHPSETSDIHSLILFNPPLSFIRFPSFHYQF